MEYNFDQIIDRKGTNSFKWDTNEEYYGNIDAIPMWVADMDFQCAEPIIKAMKARLNHKVMGYMTRDQQYYDAICDWLLRRHGWEIKREDLVFCPPGVIMGINILIQTLTKPGDKIIVQTPTYKPLSDSIKNNNRTIVKNPLKIKNGRYVMDFDDLKDKIDKDVKMLLLCSPHNPMGRVWREEELIRLGKMCLENNIFVVSDEIHLDLIHSGHKHIPFSSLSKEFAQNSAVCISTNKTFNLGGLQLATLIIANEKIREKFNNAIGTYQTTLDNIFGQVALIAGYNKGEKWLDQVMQYVGENLNYVKKYITQNIPEIQYFEPEGSYMMWLDFRGLKMPPLELRQFLVTKAGVALCDGYEFGKEGEGFMRMNIACPRSTIELALNNIKLAIENL